MCKEKKVYKAVIDLLLQVKKKKQLKTLTKIVESYEWEDDNRKIFLLGLVKGATIKFNKKQARKVLNEFKTL